MHEYHSKERLEFLSCHTFQDDVLQLIISTKILEYQPEMFIFKFLYRVTVYI